MEFGAYLADSLDLYGGACSGEEGKEEIGCSEAIRGGTSKNQSGFLRSPKISYSRMITLHVKIGVSPSSTEMLKNGQDSQRCAPLDRMHFPRLRRRDPLAGEQRRRFIPRHPASGQRAKTCEPSRSNRSEVDRATQESSVRRSRAGVLLAIGEARPCFAHRM